MYVYKVEWLIQKQTITITTSSWCRGGSKTAVPAISVDTGEKETLSINVVGKISLNCNSVLAHIQIKIIMDGNIGRAPSFWWAFVIVCVPHNLVYKLANTAVTNMKHEYKQGQEQKFLQRVTLNEKHQSA